MSVGRSLFDYPGFRRLARQYARRPQPAAPPIARIDDLVDGWWHVLRLVPGQETTAIAAIADRVHLGSYLPMRRERRPGRRGYRLVSRALFAGYGFVMVQDIARYWDQIKACPGVRGVMMMTTDGTTIPATIEDGLIRYIQRLENSADGWVAADLQDQQDELDAAWRRDVGRTKGRQRHQLPRPQPAIEIA